MSTLTLSIFGPSTNVVVDKVLPGEEIAVGGATAGEGPNIAKG